MPERIINFPGAAPLAPKREALFPGLFGDRSGGRGKVAYLSIEGLSEQLLLQIIVRNSVTGLIDLRPKPLFEHPNFEHQKIVAYFYQRRVRYFEYALLQDTLRSSSKDGVSRRNAEGEMNGLLSDGLTLCLYDNKSIERGWVQRTRHILQTSSSYVAELHPKALVGS